MDASDFHVLAALSGRNVRYRSVHPESWATQLRWFFAAAVIGFTVPFVGSNVLGLQHDLYLGIYFAAVFALLAAYSIATGLDVRAAVARHWKLGAVLGLVFGVALVFNVFSEDATPRPGGACFVFELVWRGGIYGVVDALLLTVLPCLVVYRALGGHLATWSRRLAYFGASLALVMTITAVYHLGFAQYREDGVRAPEIGNAIISMPMLLSANPLASIADHAAMHISAVVHSYETEVRLPPPAKAFASTSYADWVGDVKGGSAPDIASVTLSNSASTITFRIRFVNAPPLSVNAGEKWVDMLLIGIDVPPLGPRPATPGGEWPGANYALGTHGPSSTGQLVRLGKTHSTRAIAFEIVTRGRTLSFSIPRRALGNPAWFTFEIAAARETEGETGGGGVDVTPGRGTHRYQLS
jgi:hypothetical protein